MKTLLITGGTSGIGEATARHAVAEGHQVYVTGRQRQRLDDFLGSFDADARQRITGDVVDASSWEQTQRAVQACVDHFGGLDVAYANAGFSSRGDLLTGDPDSWRDMINTNFLGAALLIKAALPVLTERRGHFLFTGSVSRCIRATCTPPPNGPSPGWRKACDNRLLARGCVFPSLPPAMSTPHFGERPQLR